MARDRRGRVRRPQQDEALREVNAQRTRPGRTHRAHGVNMTPAAHEALAFLTPAERGDLIEAALRAAGHLADPH